MKPSGGLVKEDEDLDDDKIGIRDLTFQKLKALLAFTIVVNHNHLYARAHKEQTNISPMEMDDFMITRPCEPEPEAFFSEVNFDQ